jgi:uncharacterized membrane protein
MKLPEKTWIILLGLSCVAYPALRLWDLTSSCLWFDEIFSIHAAEHSWNSLWWFVAQDLIHPPLFYALLKIWISIGGAESLLWLRFFSVFFSTLAIIPFLLLCRQLKLTHSTIAIALTFFAFNGSLIKYAQEVRMYSLLLCLGLISSWLFVRFLNVSKGLAPLILVNILIIYSHYYGWLLLASEVVATVILARSKIYKILLMMGLAGLSFLPWASAVWQATYKNAGFDQNLGWAEKPDLWTLLQFALDFFEPVYFQQSNGEPVSNFLITVPVILLALLSFVLRLSSWEESNSEEKRNFYLLLILALFPVSLAFVVSWILPYSIWGTRHLLIVFAPLAILFAMFLDITKFRQLKALSRSAFLLLLGAGLLLQINRAKPQFIWCGWENLAGVLRSSPARAPGETVKVYAFEDMAAYNFWFALRSDSTMFQIINVNGISEDIEDKAYFLPRGFDEIQTISSEEISGNRFWILFRAGKWDESKPPLRNLLIKGYKFHRQEIFQGEGGYAFLVEVKHEIGKGK